MPPFWPFMEPQPACTSEREICLPVNYSKFQLPNKGNVTIVSIGGEHIMMSNPNSFPTEKLIQGYFEGCRKASLVFEVSTGSTCARSTTSSTRWRSLATS